MPTIASTSTGHVASGASWLNAHFESARREYEEAVRAVGIKPGWAVLDAGCGGGNFLPLLCEATGTHGTVAAIDLAPENVARVEAALRDELLKTRVQIQAGSILALPFEAARFDCVWCANVTQYLTEAELERAVQEFRRVLKPGGTLALKDFDATLCDAVPTDEPGHSGSIRGGPERQGGGSRACRHLVHAVTTVPVAQVRTDQDRAKGLADREVGTGLAGNSALGADRAVLSRSHRSRARHSRCGPRGLAVRRREPERSTRRSRLLPARVLRHGDRSECVVKGISVRTVLCERLGIEVPIIQAAIANAACPALAAAVSNAGGLGMLQFG